MEPSEGVRGRYGGRAPDQVGRGGNADSERGRGDRDGGDLRGDRGDSRDGRISNAKDVLDRGLTTMRGRGRRYDGFPGGGYDDMDRRSRGLGKARVGDERDRYLEGNAKHGGEDHYAPEVGVREAERWRPQDRENESVGYEVNEIADRRENGQGKRRVEGADDREEFDDRDGSPSHKKSRPVPREVTVVEADRYYAQRRAESAAEKVQETRRGGGAPSNGRDTAYDGDRDSDSDQQRGIDVEQKKQERKGREVLIREVRHVPMEDRDSDRVPRKKAKEGGKASGERWLPAEDEDGGGSKAKSRDGSGGHRGEKEVSRAKGRKEAGDSPVRQQQQQQRRRREEDSPESDASAGDGERESLREAPPHPRGKDDIGSREKHRECGVDKPRPRSRKDEERDKVNHRRARDITDPAKSSSAGKGRREGEDRAGGTKRRRRGRSAESSSSSGSSSSSSSSSSTGTGSASASSRSSSSGSSSSKSPTRRSALLRSPSGSSSRSLSPPPARSRHSRRT